MFLTQRVESMSWASSALLNQIACCNDYAPLLYGTMVNEPSS
jgi:hypothetical protein